MLNKEGILDALSKNFLVTEAGGQEKEKKGESGKRTNKASIVQEKLGVPNSRINS